MTTVERERRPPEYLEEPEDEVDFGRYWSLLLLRWWLPVAGVVAGVVVGYLISLGGTDVYRAQTDLYLGQPYGGLGGNAALQSPQTNPSTVNRLVRSQEVQAQAEARAGMRPHQLSGHVSTKAVAGNITKLNQTPLVTISVTAHAPRKAKIAANSLANQVVLALSGYSQAKIKLLQEQIASDDRRIAAIDRALRSGGVTASVLELQRGDIQSDRLNATQLLVQAQKIESPQVLTPASVHKTTARSRGNTMAVAGLIGLVLGIVAALLWEPLLTRLRR